MARRGRPSALSKLSITALQAEIQRRQSGVGRLVKERDALMDRLAALNTEIQAAGGEGGGEVPVPFGAGGRGRRGRAGGRRGRGGRRGLTKSGSPRKRPKNDMNLVEALKKLLSDKVMNVTSITQAVQDAGYKTSSANFRTIVNQTLIRESGTFKKVSRGQYTVK